MNFKPIQHEHQKEWNTPLAKEKKPQTNSDGEPYCVMCENLANADYVKFDLFLCVRCADFSKNIIRYIDSDGFSFVSWGVRKQVEKSKVAKKAVSKQMREKIFKRDGYKCLCCGSTERLTIDHIIPQHYVCLNTEENLQTLCFKCNCVKGANIINFVNKGGLNEF